MSSSTKNVCMRYKDSARWFLLPDFMEGVTLSGFSREIRAHQVVCKTRGISGQGAFQVQATVQADTCPHERGQWVVVFYMSPFLPLTAFTELSIHNVGSFGELFIIAPCPPPCPRLLKWTLSHYFESSEEWWDQSRHLVLISPNVRALRQPLLVPFPASWKVPSFLPH